MTYLGVAAFYLLTSAATHVASQSIIPKETEITLTSGAAYTLECRHNEPIEWHYPPSDNPMAFTLHRTEGENERPSKKIVETEERSGIYISKLRIIGAHFMDTGFYSCVAVIGLEDSAPSIYLYVRDNKNLFVNKQPFTILQATEGSSIIIPCRPTSPDVNVTLFRDESLMDGNIIDPRYGFTFPSVQVSDSGTLTCRAVRDSIKDSVTFELLVHQRTDYVPKPSITAASSLGSHVIEGETFYADCSVMVTAGVFISLQWVTPSKYDSERVTMTTSANKQLRNGVFYDVTLNRLVIKRVKKSDEGRYVCRVIDHSGNENEDSYLLRVDAIDTKYLNLTVEGSAEITVRIGEKSAKWIVTVESNPLPKLFWYNPNGKEMPTFSDKYTVQFQAGKSKVEVRELSIEDSGIYVLIADNGNEKKTLNISLLIEDKPHIQLSQQTYYKYGIQHTIACAIIAYPIPVVRWTFRAYEDYPQMESKIIDLPSTFYEMSDGVHSTSEIVLYANYSGKIACEASNNYGTASETIEFLVTDVADGFDLWGNFDAVVGDNVTFSSAIAIYHYVGQFDWLYINEKNITTSLPSTKFPGISVAESKTDFSYRSDLQILNVTKASSGLYVVRVYASYNTSAYEKVANLTVRDLVRPKFTNRTTLNGGTLDVEPGERVELHCYVEGNPFPNISWYRDGKKIYKTNDSAIKFLRLNQTLVITRMTEAYSGQYLCVAKNRAGLIKAEKNVYLYMPGVFGIVLLVIGVAVFALFVLVITIFLCFRMKKERKKFQDEMSIVGLYNFNEGQIESLNPRLDISEQAELLPYDKQFWEFPRDKLKLGQQLGSGAFGVVLKATAYGLQEQPVTVAVKMVKRNSNVLMIRNLASELKILAHLGKHLNVVNLIGACTENISNRELLVIVEYCKYGNLHNYLQKHRMTFRNQVNPVTGRYDPKCNETAEYTNFQGFHGDGVYSKSIQQTTGDQSNNLSATTMVTSLSAPVGDDGYLLNRDGEFASGYYQGDYKFGSVGPICTKDLLMWSYQVSRGMEYLASRKILHGDLAARNVLLAENNIVKICDFGLAKNMYNDDNYCKKGTDLLPVKWMSIEALRDRIFSTQSDIWAFGVVLWEFFTLARSPYPGRKYDEEFLKSLINGHRLEKPDYSPDSMYTLMLECWSYEPMSRPSFSECVERIGNLLEDNDRKHYTELNDLYQNTRTEQEDYLAMLNDPTFDNLTSISSNDYVTEPGTHTYLNMQKTRNCNENANEVELKPMLPKD